MGNKRRFLRRGGTSVSALRQVLERTGCPLKSRRSPRLTLIERPASSTSPDSRQAASDWEQRFGMCMYYTGAGGFG